MGKNSIKKEFSAGGIIMRKNKNCLEALIIKDSFGNYAFPKGHIEENESIEEAAKREIAEEVGLDKLELIAEIGVNEYYFTDKFNNNAKVHKFVHYFLFMTSPESLVKVQAEEGIKDPKWIPINKLVESINYDNLKPIAQKAEQFLNNYDQH